MKYSILIQGSGEAQTGQTTAADILASKLVSELQSGKHFLSHASIILDDATRLPLVGGEIPHEVPAELLSKPLEEIPAELKKLDKKELIAALMGMRMELDAFKASVGKAISEAEKPGVIEDETEEDDVPGDGAPGEV